MARQPESSVPRNEELYRSVSVDDVVNGVLQPHAVEMPACSFNRAAYSLPEDVFTLSRPRDNGIAEITSAELPPQIPRVGAPPFEFVVGDDPTPTNDAHCEIRLQRVGSPYNQNHASKTIRQLAKVELTRRMRLRVPPT